jgi:oxygen-independent coproporphyrinogen-3 oxidase
LTADELGPIALYVHIPFCETRCPYCDFNTYAGVEALIPSYVQALQREIALWGESLGRPTVKTVFFGGGTPSYLPAEQIRAVVETTRSAMDLVPEAEVTIEANPGDLTPAKLSTYVGCGVNRLSIGVQSLNDRLLGILGRRHSAAQAVQAYRSAVDAGLDNISIDLMYGLPYQTIGDWEQTMNGALALASPHVSVYCLTLEGGTPMERQVGAGLIPEPDPDLAADMYLLAGDALARRGYEGYEISNWALPGFESRHNLVYWRNQPYLGVGPGAHSYLPNVRFSNVRSPQEYVRRLRDDRSSVGRTLGTLAGDVEGTPAIESVEAIDRRLEMAETLMLGLRLDAGVGVDEFALRFGATPAQVYGATIDDLGGLGLLGSVDGRLRLTPRGRLLGNEVFARFF